MQFLLEAYLFCAIISYRSMDKYLLLYTEKEGIVHEAFIDKYVKINIIKKVYNT